MLAGQSLRAGGRGSPSATMNVVPGYFYRKIEELGYLKDSNAAAHSVDTGIS